MTKRIRRISDADLIAIEADLVHLDAEFTKLNFDEDPVMNDRINQILARISDLEERALGRAPVSMLGLAVQARVVARYVSCDSMVGKLIRNIETMSAVPPLEPGIRLQDGKRYLKRNGTVTATIYRIDRRGLLFADDCSGDMYEADGRCLATDRTEDLVEEIAQAPRVRKQPSRRVPVEIEHWVAA